MKKPISDAVSLARQQAAVRLAHTLLATEAGVESALAGGGRILMEVADARAGLDLSVLHGQRLAEDAAELTATLVRARALAGRLHQTMAATQRQIGVRAVLPNPGDKPDQGTEPFLTAVEPSHAA